MFQKFISIVAILSTKIETLLGKVRSIKHQGLHGIARTLRRLLNESSLLLSFTQN